MNAPATPRPRLCIGVTGHREDNATFAANQARIAAVLEQVLDRIAAAVEAEAAAPEGPTPERTRLHCLLDAGTDHLAAESAIARGWELVAPLPFGLALDVAINARPATLDEARALLAGQGGAAACSPDVRARAERIHALALQARLFELADRDDELARQYLAQLASPGDRRLVATFAAEVSLRAALAARVMLEQSDLLIAIWDGVTRALVGGTGHTVQVALETGAPVLWIDANAPEQWRILEGPESLLAMPASQVVDGAREEGLARIVRRALRPAERPGGRANPRRAPAGSANLERERLPRASNPLFHLYRRVELLFGTATMRERFRGLRQRYETPEAIATGSGAPLLARARALPGHDKEQIGRIELAVLRRFAWADGVSSHLSDVYRGSMTANFLLATLAIVGGMAYLPFASPDSKWAFALFELAVLAAILVITIRGQRRRWHVRWLESRRVAEYLRHAPVLLLLGVTRPPGRWPVDTETSWPEWYARHGLREVGLPRVRVTQAWLREAVGGLLRDHVVGQRDYHVRKAGRLAAVHHNLDTLSEALFKLAVVSVGAYLLLKAGGVLQWWSPSLAQRSSSTFTFLGVLLPTLGGAIAGIRYFGDFERFAAISRVTAGKLDAIAARIEMLLAAPEGALDYGRAAELAHDTDGVVVDEIESWQAVFGGKHVTVPV